MVLLDAGHGGHDGQNYHSISGGKLFKHAKEGYHGNGFFYEGVWNRDQLNLVRKELDGLSIPYIVISDDLIDLPLRDRVSKANYFHSLYPNAFVISLHANASVSHNGRGYEVFTSRGKTASDKLATLHYNFVSAMLPKEVKLRSDRFSDGDPDKEANFFILKRTTCPAILVEHLFFDNKYDVELLMDSEICQAFAKATAYAAKAFINER